ncbi:MAG: glycoside hydrolase family 99-like domain-containing protein [Bacteroidales bacterium]|nr:glycoside hydrolase family 99-like domain-containing protein [Bacteroidales bacterium]
MRINHSFLKFFGIVLLLIGLMLCWQCNPSPEMKDDNSDRQVYDEDYTVAAYYWPSTHDEPRSRKVFWSEGIGEWEMIKKTEPRFKGHYQPRQPLWGYEMGNNPQDMEKKIAAAADHGVDAFIFDWYWYDGEPFLEETVNKGFLKADNNERLKFYLMWANHDAKGVWNHQKYDLDSVIWKGTVDWKNFKTIVDRVINKYFKHPSYLKIKGEPVFSIYHLENLISSFDGIEGTKEALKHFRSKVKEAGFPGLHLQLIGRARNDEPFLLGGKYGEKYNIKELVTELGANSVTSYQWVHYGLNEDYIKWGEQAFSLMNKWDKTLEIPFSPHVSIGWDNTPRYPQKGKESVVHIHNNPASFAAYFQKAKDYVDNHPDEPNLITINAWNEWVEGSYLEPDMRWGYGYLEAVEKIMKGTYDQYHRE